MQAKYLCLAVLLLLTSVETIKASHAHKSEYTEQDVDLDKKQPPRCKNGIEVTLRERMISQKSFENCTRFDKDTGKLVPLRREDVVEYVYQHFDFNKDFVIIEDECHMAINELIPDWKIREVAMKLIPACEEIFTRCDCNADKKITLKDFQDSPDSCLGHCERVQLAIKYAVDRDFTPDKNGKSLH